MISNSLARFRLNLHHLEAGSQEKVASLSPCGSKVRPGLAPAVTIPALTLLSIMRGNNLPNYRCTDPVCSHTATPRSHVQLSLEISEPYQQRFFLETKYKLCFK